MAQRLPVAGAGVDVAEPPRLRCMESGSGLASTLRGSRYVRSVATSRFTVVYESTAGDRHKLCRLLLTDDGSYFVTIPYHDSEHVSLSKRIVNYPNPAAREADPPLEIAVMEDDEHRLKLSHHPDGFVQFSGHGIVSGRNPDGSPKGLGIQSFPLNRPTAGPTCALTIMQPTAFAPAEVERQGDVVFRDAELFGGPEDNGLFIELFYFAGLWRRFIKMRDGRPVIWIRHPSGAVIEAQVCLGEGEAWATGFLGVDAWAGPVRLGDQESGFAISSPTSIRGYDEESRELEAEALIAAYPPITDERAEHMDLMFPGRDDPPYHAAGESPSAGP